MSLGASVVRRTPATDGCTSHPGAKRSLDGSATGLPHPDRRGRLQRMPRPNFLYTFATFPGEGLAELDSSFANLPFDPYIAGRFRLRRFSHFTGPADRLVR